MARQRNAPHTPAIPWRWARLGAAAGVLLATLVWAPARWLASAVVQASDGRLQLRQARGTVWAGDAVLTLAPDRSGSDVRSLPGRLRWQFGLGLARPGLTLQLSNPCCTPQAMQWRLGWEAGAPALSLADQTSQWPLALLAGLGAPWNTLQAEGQLHWQSSGLRLGWAEGRLRWHGQSELRVQDVGSRLSTLRPMGSYRIMLRGADGTATPDIDLATLNGPLRLSGKGQWLGQRLRFEGEASAEEGSEAALSNLLNIIGRREGPRSRLSLG